uniref:Uncharacterized protein n=1 Tax=Arundo donax TaxID=35708 RepID=A0A0A8YTI6_ARUDO
MVCRVQVVT